MRFRIVFNGEYYKAQCLCNCKFLWWKWSCWYDHSEPVGYGSYTYKFKTLQEAEDDLKKWRESLAWRQHIREHGWQVVKEVGETQILRGNLSDEEWLTKIKEEVAAFEEKCLRAAAEKATEDGNNGEEKK